MSEKLNDSKTCTARNGEDFAKEIEYIKNQRLELHIDKKRKSTRILTNLIIKHNFWPTIKAELIKLDLRKIKNE